MNKANLRPFTWIALLGLRTNYFVFARNAPRKRPNLDSPYSPSFNVQWTLSGELVNMSTAPKEHLDTNGISVFLSKITLQIDIAYSSVKNIPLTFCPIPCGSMSFPSKCNLRVVKET